MAYPYHQSPTIPGAGEEEGRYWSNQPQTQTPQEDTADGAGGFSSQQGDLGGGGGEYAPQDPSTSSSTSFLHPLPLPPPPHYSHQHQAQQQAHYNTTATQREERQDRRIQHRHAPYPAPITRRPQSAASTRKASVAGPGRVETRSISYQGSTANTPYTSPIVPLDASFPPPQPPQQQEMMSRFPIIPPPPPPSAQPPASPIPIPSSSRKPYLIRTDIVYTTPPFPPQSSSSPSPPSPSSPSNNNSTSRRKDPNARTLIAIMELPGVLPSDLRITLSTNPLSHIRQVTVKGVCRPPRAYASLLLSDSDQERTAAGGGKKERRYGEVTRTFPVSSHTKVEDIKAHLEHGVLILQIFVGPPLLSLIEEDVPISFFLSNT